MLPRVGNLLPRSRDSSESMDYFFLEFPTSTSTLACVSLSSWMQQLNDHQVLGIILNLGNPKYVWRQIPLDLTKDSHTQQKEQLKTWLGFSLLYLRQNIKPYMLNGLGLSWKILQKKKIYMTFDRSNLILDRSSQANLTNKLCSTLNSNFTYKHTLSKS